MKDLHKDLKILIVDDQLPSRTLAKMRLRELGFENLHEAEDGREAMEMLAEAIKQCNRFKLILLDHEMPEVSGFQLFRMLQMSEEGKGVGVIMVTAHSRPELVSEMIQKGIRSFIVKPLTTEALQKKMLEAMASVE